MYIRTGTSVGKSGGMVKSVTVKVKIKSSEGPWKVTDVQFQEGAVVTEYTEHISEMGRSGG